MFFLTRGEGLKYITLLILTDLLTALPAEMVCFTIPLRLVTAKKMACEYQWPGKLRLKNGFTCGGS